MNASTHNSPLGKLFSQMTSAERALLVATQVYEARDKPTDRPAHMFTWTPCPSRPMNIPGDDLVLCEIIEDYYRGDAVDGDKKKVMRSFHGWRAAVWTVEEKNAVRARMLVLAYRTFDSLGRSAEADAIVEVLATFGGIDWGRSPHDPVALLAYAKRQLIDTLTMSWRLRNAGMI